MHSTARSPAYLTLWSGVTSLRQRTNAITGHRLVLFLYLRLGQQMGIGHPRGVHFYWAVLLHLI